MKHLLQRRKFMKSLGAAGFALPFYDIIHGKTAKAACGDGVAKRIIFFYHPNGATANKWHAIGSGSNFSLNFAMEPLQDIKNKGFLTPFRGLMYTDCTGNTHWPNAHAALTGNQGVSNRSLNIELAETVGANDFYKHIHLGVGNTIKSANEGNHGDGVTFAAPGVGAKGEDSPNKAWETFLNGVTGGNNSNQNSPRRSVVDSALKELNALKSQLGAVEQAKLDQHIASMEAIERRLGVNLGDCGALDQSPLSIDSYRDNTLLMDQVMDAQIDIMVAAMACGVSRVGTIEFGHHTFDVPINFPNTTIAQLSNSYYHGLSHNDGNDLARVNQWVNQKVASLCQKLDTINEPDCSGTMLENTIIYVFSECSDWGGVHGEFDQPVYIAGGAGGSMNVGKVYDTNGAPPAGVESDRDRSGVPHNRILVSMANAMGHGISSFGGYGSGQVAGLNT
jgi:hypothetical protein